MSRPIIKEIENLAEKLADDQLLPVLKYLKEISSQSTDNQDAINIARKILEEESSLLRRLAE